MPGSENSADTAVEMLISTILIYPAIINKKKQFVNKLNYIKFIHSRVSTTGYVRK